MLGVLFSKSNAKPVYPGAYTGGPARASTFNSQQAFEDKIEALPAPLSLAVPAIATIPAKAKVRPNDVEAQQAGFRPANVSPSVPGAVPLNAAAKQDVKTSTAAIPVITITGDDSASDSTTVVPDSVSVGDVEEKESYDFLVNDGRWHHKPHVYEYNKASARLLQTAKPNLFGTICQKDRSRPKKCVLNVATMQAIVIRTYQREIVEAGREMTDGKTSVLLPQLLHKYCDALRDMDYMQEKAANGFEDDPFLLMTSKQMEKDLMEDYGLVPDFVDPRGDLPTAHDSADPRLPGIGRTDRLHRAQLENKYHKLYSVLGGGLALIIPMVIMRLEPGKVSCLVTTCGCVAIFSLAIAFRSDMRPNEILAVTAAYTAVLVVFVGTTT
ncbi:hypothetical protein CLAFUW4_08143 [Fulvia fulva]|uniref:DUF6594 domain-containing protein n=1 Tax=Passalora fulva TaxID=5499 RepID=A0A9Q8LCU2_PASFU|nr:uncharacterized protein CLAFUR5_08257 [Fulvia fulva]KAK4628932.1 hypothetical protein CLAFUR4_08148 [Fulvia fulva]KAK4630809.1 hypothetical protein CLAFUR0_08143 [Fulvia fulva]UJO15019.1 hypothetical protein CLAFUR5_08257 [Fulvia fulva]WPV12110.1 hypothetical protein CLAFUW4_08143 [Fulvia fulva]WPV27956.1 hypothetical protein CLAFUW7_08143 [Fulvia fulva]